MDAPVAVVLAAGKSTRMKSDTPKVLHEVCGRPMIERVLDAVRATGVKRTVLVVGHRAELVKQHLSHHSDVDFALQAEQKGTGHAVMVCEQALAGHQGPVMVLAGDTPLLRAESLSALLEEQRTHQAACVIGTAVTDANQGLGRIVRDAEGRFVKIVEQKDATPEEAKIREINTGCFVFHCQDLFESLRQLRPNNQQGEYYLTDCPAILLAQGRPVLASNKLDITEALGVNTRAQLAEVTRSIEQAFLEQLMVDGVTIVSPDQTYIDPRAAIGPETIVHPFTYITGPANIGARCQIGPHAVVSGDVTVADESVIKPFQCVTS